MLYFVLIAGLVTSASAGAVLCPGRSRRGAVGGALCFVALGLLLLTSAMVKARIDHLVDVRLAVSAAA